MFEDVQYSLCQLFHYIFSIYVGPKLRERERETYLFIDDLDIRVRYRCLMKLDEV